MSNPRKSIIIISTFTAHATYNDNGFSGVTHYAFRALSGDIQFANGMYFNNASGSVSRTLTTLEHLNQANVSGSGTQFTFRNQTASSGFSGTVLQVDGPATASSGTMFKVRGISDVELFNVFASGNSAVGTATDNTVGKLQVQGKITVSTHTLGSNSDSAVIWDRSTGEYKYAKINGGSSTTLYTGDGTLGGNRIVTASNNDLTFATTDMFAVNSNYNVWAKNDASRTYTSAIGLTGANYWQFAYTTGAGNFTRGNALVVDTLNNIGLGDPTVSTMPLYTNGASTYVKWGLQSQGANYYAVQNITSNTTLTNLGYNFIAIDATSGNITITLPSASSSFGASMGLDLVFKRIDNSGNSVTVQRAGSDLIDGANSFTLTTQWEDKKLRCSSTSTWSIY